MLKFTHIKFVFLLSIIFLTSCANLNQQFGSRIDNSESTYRVYGKKYHVLKTSKNYKENGYATWYGKRFHKKRTFSGERYDMYQLTAAHKTLPLSTHVQVKNLLNGKSLVVRVNDRGPFVRNRVIDLSYAAAKELHMVGAGVVPVEVKAIDTVENRG